MAEMYNSEIKLRYIEYKTDLTIVPDKYLERLFIKTERFETELGKDVSNFTYYEIMNMYKTWNEASYEVLQVSNSHLSLYTQWCIEQSLVVDAQNHYLEFNKDMFMTCTNSMINDKKIVTREQVLQWANQLNNPSDSFIFLALFEGIKGEQYKELTNLKLSDFHDGKVDLCTGRTIEISTELYNFALQASQEEFYYSYGATKPPIRLLNEDLIVKNYPNTVATDDEYRTGRRLYNRIIRCAKSVGIGDYMKGNTFYESGRIAFIKQRSEELGIGCREFVFEHSDEIIKQFGCRIPSKGAFYEKYEKYLA